MSAHGEIEMSVDSDEFVGLTEGWSTMRVERARDVYALLEFGRRATS